MTSLRVKDAMERVEERLRRVNIYLANMNIRIILTRIKVQKYLKGISALVVNLLLSMKAVTIHSRLFEEYRVKESLQILLFPQTTHSGWAANLFY